MTVVGRSIGQVLEYQLKLRPIQCYQTILFATADRSYSAIGKRVLMRSYERSSVIQKSNDGKSLVVHIDGCAINNGQPDARAGIGVFWGEDDPRNLSEPLEDGKQTNQRAEIMAAIRVLETCNDTKLPLLIYTDSIYLKNAHEKWIKKWEAKEEKNENCGWKASNNKPVSNEDLFRRLIALTRSREGVVNIKWVKAHHKSKDNIAADKLANLGALKSRNTVTTPAAAQLDNIVKKTKKRAEKLDKNKYLFTASNTSSITNTSSPSINVNDSDLTEKNINGDRLDNPTIADLNGRRSSKRKNQINFVFLS
ncbi:102_t:CDS:2 [Paraglomus occultum]|uniref:ribonuclease H n=1 Tax=Paraglomus occultum TaxID=144539 RepID=A0A9N8ZBT9_9GLOM|nr:102_t:CDS:2 [Paraglomus occultum]